MVSLSNKIVNPTKFDPSTSVGDLSEKVIIVTGGNAGVGRATVEEIAKHNPKRLYATARSQEKFDAALKAIRENVPGASVEFLQMDLTSLASVDAAAKKVLADNDRLDVLINNAGIMAVPYAVTKEGYEVQFGTNHIGHALFTRQLTPLLVKTAALPDSDVRIVNVSSAGHGLAPSKGVIFDKIKSDMKDTHNFTLYGQSKLANILYAKELAKRYPQITSTSVHPGRVSTGLLDHLGGFMGKFQAVYDWAMTTLTVEQGALSPLFAGFYRKAEVVNGGYYTPVGNAAKGDHKKVSDPKASEELSGQLWDWQEAEFKALGY